VRTIVAAVALTVAVAVVLASCSDSGSASGSTTTVPPTSTTVAPTTTTTLIVVTSPTWFSTPTGNISCAVLAEYARCDIVDRTWAPPTKPSDCPLDWGSSLVVAATQTGKFSCSSDTVYRPEVQMPWGRRVTDGSMSCDVVSEGVTCRSSDGHGFFLSRESYRLF
jgi:hypothetical protein